MQESEEKEMRLKEDDPAALEVVLKYAYTGKLALPVTDESNFLDNFNSCIAQYEVSNKYLFNNFQERLMTVFLRNLEIFFTETVKYTPKPSPAHFDTINRMYAVEGTDAKGENPFARCLLELLFRGDDGQSIYYQVDRNLWIQIAQKVPEFGRDLFVRVAGGSELTPALLQISVFILTTCFVDKVQVNTNGPSAAAAVYTILCSSCDGSFVLARSDVVNRAMRYCSICGVRGSWYNSIID